MLWRSALRADSAAMLEAGSRRATRCARCVRCAQTGAARQITRRAARADPAPALLAARAIAPRRRPPAARTPWWRAGRTPCRPQRGGSTVQPPRRSAPTRAAPMRHAREPPSYPQRRARAGRGAPARRRGTQGPRPRASARFVVWLGAPVRDAANAV